MARRRNKQRSRKLAAWGWAIAGFSALGYIPTVLMGRPVLSMTLAAGLMVFFARRASSLRRAALRGAGLGLLTGLGIFSALANPAVPAAAGPAMVFLLATVALCAGASALFFRYSPAPPDGWR